MALLILFAMAVPDCAAALAGRLGRARYSGTLSSNRAIRKQQLIVDPENIIGGSASTFYDPSLVSLVGFSTDVPFLIDNASIGITVDNGLTRGVMPVAAFLTARGLPPATLGNDGQFAGLSPLDVDPVPASPMRETGFIQFGFDLNPVFLLPDAARIKPPPGYVVVDEAGPTEGEDTHALLFDFIGPPDRVAEYTVFADDGTRTGSRDFLLPRGPDGRPGEVIRFDEIDPVTVRGALDPDARPPPGVPLPPAALLGAFGLVGAWISGRRMMARHHAAEPRLRRIKKED